MYIIGAYGQHHLQLLVLTLITWLRQGLSGFSTAQMPFSFPLFLFVLWEEVTIHSLPLGNGELCYLSLRAEHLYKLFGVPQHRFVYFPSLFMCSIIYTYQYELLDIYFHFLKIYNLL